MNKKAVRILLKYSRLELSIIKHRDYLRILRAMKGSAAMQIAGVHELAIANTKVFVIQAQKNVLVDTGSAPLHDEVMAFLEKTGFAFESEEQKKLMKEGAGETIIRFLREKKLAIDAILCTHCHGDHTGNLKELKEYLQVPVAVHELDIPVVEGREQPAAPSFIPPEILTTSED